MEIETNSGDRKLGEARSQNGSQVCAELFQSAGVLTPEANPSIKKQEILASGFWLLC